MYIAFVYLPNIDDDVVMFIVDVLELISKLVFGGGATLAARIHTTSILRKIR